jgi:hypothetical protein
MNKPIKTTVLTVRNSISPAPSKRGFLLVALVVVWLAVSPTVRAVTPPPDGGYANENTAEGTQALFSLTTGEENTASGYQALFSNTTGGFNTAIGDSALSSNTTGGNNTATGSGALFFNTTGSNNTATGFEALIGCNTEFCSSSSGNDNTANGAFALFSITTGSNNTATGSGALVRNDAGNQNTANGAGALSSTTGSNNTATGFNALTSDTTGSNNTAEGLQGLFHNTTGSNNIALGSSAGVNLTTGNNNIDIGARGVAGESNTIRIGRIGLQKAAYMQGISGATVASGVTVIVDTNGRLGTVQSSARFKDEIKPMDKASEAILALKPVTFRYKKELDPDGIPQFGLVAEQVEKVNPDLVARDEKGQVYAVRYEAVNAMLVNEFLKEHHKVQELETIVAQQRQESRAQREEIKALTAGIKEQAAQIQKVSAQLELRRPALKMIANNQ